MLVNYNFIVAALLLIVFDILTGVLAAMITGTFKSSKMREGGKRKLFLTVVVIFGVVLDYVQHIAELGINVPACTLICGYISLMEIMSIIENINKAYPNALPKKLIAVLQSGAEQAGVDKSSTQ